MGWQEDFREEMRQSAAATRAAARVATGEWIRELGPWHLFGGLTFDPRRCAHSLRSDGPCSMERLIGDTWVPRAIPLDWARVRFESWHRAAQRALGRRIDYVAAVEGHRSGAGHVHPLLRLEGGLQRGDVVDLGGLWYERNGYGLLSVPVSLEQVTGYCAKYMVKPAGTYDLLLSKGLRVP